MTLGIEKVVEEIGTLVGGKVAEELENKVRCYQHVRAKRAFDGGLNLNLGK